MEESIWIKRERELRAQDKLEELDRMYEEELGFQTLLPQREIMKIPLPMSYEDYFMLKWRYGYSSGTAREQPIAQCRSLGEPNGWIWTRRS
jgi:hypothetical protein